MSDQQLPTFLDKAREKIRGTNPPSKGTALRRNPPPLDAGIDIDPEVSKQFGRFLTQLKETRQELAETSQRLEDAEIEIEKLHAQIQWRDQELTRCAKSRDEHQAGFCELRAQVAIIVSQAMAYHAQNQSQYENFKSVAEAAMESVRDRMRKAGVEPAGERTEQRPQTEEEKRADKEAHDAITQLAAKFGANSRPPSDNESVQ